MFFRCYKIVVYHSSKAEEDLTEEPTTKKELDASSLSMSESKPVLVDIKQKD